MITRRFHSVLLTIAVVLSSATFALGEESSSEPHPAAPKGTAAFAMLVVNVMSSKDVMEVELPLSPDLDLFLTRPANGRYVVKQLTVTKGDEVRGLSVALHAPDDIFLMRGKEVAGAFEGMYYVVDRTGWLRSAAFQEGKTITQVPIGDVWQAYETEKAFWIWMAGQIAQSSPRPADAPAPR
jgi:hypothetical protein